MKIQRLGMLLQAAALFVFAKPCTAAPRDQSTDCSTSYENHNQADYGPLKVTAVLGTSDIRVGNQTQPGVARACFVLFTEVEHKLVVSVRGDADGRFELKDVSPGRYRLVARAEGFCTANIPLEVLKSHRRKTRILVHFRAAGIDACSYGEIAWQRAPKIRAGDYAA